MFAKINNENFKKIIILFWTLWWLIALWTDIIGGMAQLGWLHATWSPNTNYLFLVSSLAMYHVPSWLPAFFFIGILISSMLSTAFFIWASLSINKNSSVWLRRAEIAFIISLTYWLAFFLADQTVMKFDLEQNHMVQGGFELITYLALYIL